MSKLEAALVLALLILLPSQLGYHFWPDLSLVNGIRVDYLSPTLYLTDLLIILLMVLRGPRVKVYGLTILFAVLNISFSVSPLISVYQWTRVYEYYWLFKYLTSRQNLFINIQLGLKLAILWTALLAWVQLLLQRSVGGPLYWLGERTFSLSTPGIAKVFLPSLGLVLRPYSVLPHPNALAGWLLVAGLISGGWPQLVSWITVPITFSRSSILLMPLYIWRRSKIVALLFFSVFALLFIRLGNPASWSERNLLFNKSIEVVKTSPFWGVGLGNFVSFVPSMRQPVHNIYLLLVAELGIPAFIVLTFIIIKSLGHLLRFETWDLRLAVLVVAATGLVDHYWLTLHQNILLLVIVLAVGKMIRNEVKNKL